MSNKATNWLNTDLLMDRLNNCEESTFVAIKKEIEKLGLKTHNKKEELWPSVIEGLFDKGIRTKKEFSKNQLYTLLQIITSSSYQTVQNWGVNVTTRCWRGMYEESKVRILNVFSQVFEDINEENLFRLNVDVWDALLILTTSANLYFNPNEKVVIAVMLSNPSKEYWTAEEIVNEIAYPKFKKSKKILNICEKNAWYKPHCDNDEFEKHKEAYKHKKFALDFNAVLKHMGMIDES